MTAYTMAGNGTLRDIGNAAIWGVATARAGGDTIDTNGWTVTQDQDSKYGLSGTTSTSWGNITINNCIYEIKNLITGKKYIGQTTRNCCTRWKQHIDASKNKNKNSILYNSMKKYGIQNFEFSIIDIAENIEQLNHKEKFWIKYYNTIEPHGYNMTTGGLNFKRSPQNIKKMSIITKTRLSTKEAREQLAENTRQMFIKNPQLRKLAAERAIRTFTGRKKTEEECKKHSDSQRGVPKSKEHCAAVSLGKMKGKKIGCSNGKIYQTLAECSIDTGAGKSGIIKVCRNERNHTKNLKFWWIKE